MWWYLITKGLTQLSPQIDWQTNHNMHPYGIAIAASDLLTEQWSSLMLCHTISTWAPLLLKCPNTSMCTSYIWDCGCTPKSQAWQSKTFSRAMVIIFWLELCHIYAYNTHHMCMDELQKLAMCYFFAVRVQLMTKRQHQCMQSGPASLCKQCATVRREQYSLLGNDWLRGSTGRRPVKTKICFVLVMLHDHHKVG